MSVIETKTVLEVSQPSRLVDHQLDDLVQICLAEPSCGKLLHFLAEKPSTLMTLPDITACLGRPCREIETGLRVLEKSGLLRKLSVGGLTFYGLSDDAHIRRLTERFRSWCAEQRQRWRAVEGLVACA